MQGLELATVGITAVIYVFRLSEYFENEVKKAAERRGKLEDLDTENDQINDAIEAQKHVISWYTGKWKRLSWVWLPALLLLVTFIILLFEYRPDLWIWIYFVALLTPSLGAAWGMRKRPVAKFQEVYYK